MSQQIDARQRVLNSFANYVWPAQEKFFAVALNVNTQSAPDLQVIEQTLYDLVRAQYPDLNLHRVIKPNAGSYYVEIQFNKSIHELKQKLDTEDNFEVLPGQTPSYYAARLQFAYRCMSKFFVGLEILGAKPEVIRQYRELEAFRLKAHQYFDELSEVDLI